MTVDELYQQLEGIRKVGHGTAIVTICDAQGFAMEASSIGLAEMCKFLDRGHYEKFEPCKRYGHETRPIVQTVIIR